MIFESFLTFLGKVFCFTSYVNNKGSFPQPLTPEEERDCIERTKNGDKAAREKLIRHNLRLVAHIVKKYSNAGEADDLISVGSIGLIKGIETFEYGKGSQLATYAAKCIENEILMYIRANKKHRGNLSLSESVGVDKEGNEITLMDILPMKEESVFKKVETGILLEKVLKVIDTALKGRENTIIKMRYGIGYPRSYTQLEIAAKLNISRSYVSRIEKKALEKIYKELDV
ncbi:RNA polymerase sporulation sigma factor SigK [Pumilibacter intestinalis]|uniref:RNA polymerase sporulation sigma factor SigK n=1 Tax=Pumilibacter intestinalis TaxID=2941511 RepID=UPI00203B60B9|nr:RNA polymerase sporulation sigma factor SigK [Pumilibacter intestinalis]